MIPETFSYFHGKTVSIPILSKRLTVLLENIDPAGEFRVNVASFCVGFGDQENAACRAAPWPSKGAEMLTGGVPVTLPFASIEIPAKASGVTVAPSGWIGIR